MADLQKYKKNEKNKEKSAKHRACVIICLVTNALNGGKTRLQIAAKGFCLLRRAAFRGICRRRFFAEFVFYRIFVKIRKKKKYFKKQKPQNNFNYFIKRRR